MKGNPKKQVCDGCHIQFPKEKRYVASFIIEGGEIEHLCSVCALKKTRVVHNNPKYYFQTKSNRKRHKLTIKLLEAAGVLVAPELGVQTF